MKVSNNASVHFSVTCELSEDEARALDALAGYGTKPFLEMFYKQLGKHYMKPYAHGLGSLFETIKSDVVPALRKIDEARDILSTPREDK